MYPQSRQIVLRQLTSDRRCFCAKIDIFNISTSQPLQVTPTCALVHVYWSMICDRLLRDANDV